MLCHLALNFLYGYLLLNRTIKLLVMFQMPNATSGCYIRQCSSRTQTGQEP